MPKGFPLILASQSPRRRDLLRQIGVNPDEIISPNCDETPLKGEVPRLYALRIAREKAEVVGAQQNNAYILSADTVVAVGRRILPKAETLQEAEVCLNLLSGRAHRVYTSIALLMPQEKGGKLISKCVETRLHFKRLSHQERKLYLQSGEWQGKAGGYAIQGRAGAFILSLNGSYTAVVGLPLYEVSCLLSGVGVPCPNLTIIQG